MASTRSPDTTERRTDSRPDGAPSGSLAAARRALRRGNVEEASALLESLVPRDPEDLHLLSLLARARSELGDRDAAGAALERARKAFGQRDAVLILESEFRIAGGEFDAAREILRRARDENRENIVVAGLLGLLDFFEPAAGTGGEADPESPPLALDLPGHLLWFEPLLAHLLFFLERRMEVAPVSAKLHEVRTALFRPDLRPEAFRLPSTGALEGLLARLRSKKSNKRRRQEREIISRIIGGDLSGAAAGLKSWLREDPGALGSRDTGSDPRVLLLLEVLFATDRFREMLEEIRAAGEESLRKSLPLLPCLAAYAELNRGKTEKAGEWLDSAAERTGPGPETAHLRSLVELRRGRVERVVPWLRRAFRGGDVPLVELARREMEFLEVGRETGPDGPRRGGHGRDGHGRDGHGSE